MLASVIAAVIAGIALFFLLPIFGKPREAFLRWIGIKHSRKSETLTEDPKGEMITKPADTEVSKLGLVNRLSPFEISRTIESAPPLQQSEVAKHYIGIRLDCIGELFSMKREGGGLIGVHIMVWTPTRSLSETVHVHFMVYQADYAGLALIKAGEPIHVSGLIKKVEPRSISLRNSKIIS